MLSSPFGSTVDHHRPDYRNDHPCHHGCHIHRQQHLRTCPIAHQRTRIKRWPEKWGARPNVWSIGLPEQQIGRLVAQNPWKDFKSFPREKKVSFECQSSFRIRRMKGCKLQPMCVCVLVTRDCGRTIHDPDTMASHSWNRLKRKHSKKWPNSELYRNCRIGKRIDKQIWNNDIKTSNSY